MITTDKKEVLYIRDSAFFQCDCGKNVAVTRFSPISKYEGSCICGIKWELKNNQLCEIPKTK